MKWIMLFMSKAIYFFYYAVSDYPLALDIQPFPFCDQKISPQAFIHYGCIYTSWVFVAIALGLFAKHYPKSFLIIVALEIFAAAMYFCRYGRSFYFGDYEVDTMTFRLGLYLVVAVVNFITDVISSLNETT